jgi:Cellulose binding domain
MMRRLAVSLLATLVAVTTLFVISGPAQAATPSCAVSYAMVNQWGGGYFQTQITVSYSGFAPAYGWMLSFDFASSGQRIVGGWNGAWSQAGTHVTVSSGSYSSVLSGGGSFSLGFTGSCTGVNPPPENFTFDGVPCSQFVPSDAF